MGIWCTHTAFRLVTQLKPAPHVRCRFQLCSTPSLNRVVRSPGPETPTPWAPVLTWYQGLLGVSAHHNHILRVPWGQGGRGSPGAGQQQVLLRRSGHLLRARCKHADMNGLCEVLVEESAAKGHIGRRTWKTTRGAMACATSAFRAAQRGKGCAVSCCRCCWMKLECF